MAKNEKLGIKVPVTLEVEQRSLHEVERTLQRLSKDQGSALAGVKKLAQVSSSNIKQLNEIGRAAKAFGDKLSKSAQSSAKELAELGDRLKTMTKQAEELEEELSGAADGPARDELVKNQVKLSKSISELNDSIEKSRNSHKRHIGEIQKVTEQQRKFQASLQKSGAFGKGDAFKGVAGGLKQALQGAMSGSLGNMSGGLKSALQSAGKGAAGGVARQAASSAAMNPDAAAGAAEMAAAGKALTVATAGITAGAAAIGMFIQLLMAASANQTRLNKAIVSGTSIGKDLVTDTKAYSGAINELRNAAINSRDSMVRLGMSSEDALNNLSAYAKESSGSVLELRDRMKYLGRGDIAAGVEQFAVNAQVYGKALGLEATEVASMMGKFETEAGYGFDQVQGVMENVVKAAATANMPMTKFMGIFHSVIPDVELYQNRIEELTGVVKLLSKTMSAKDVKNFTDAFARGFKGTDFKQRLKTMLIVGEGKVSKALQADFQAKANAMGKSFEKYVSPDEFQKAFQGGEKSMAALINKAQAKASESGDQLSGTEVSNAMKLASNEEARKKGGLDTVTAMSGAGMVTTYKILKEQSQAFTKGFTGLSEHVIKMTGVTEQQYDALRTMDQSMKVSRDQLDKYGQTNSKSLNAALKEQIAARKHITASQVTMKDMKEATEDDILIATEKSNEDKKLGEKAKNLAEEQYNATASIGDKLENYIGFLLEKIYQAMDGVLDAINDVFSWMTSKESKSAQEVSLLGKQIKDWNKDQFAKTPGAGEFVDTVSKGVQDGIKLGKTGGELAKHAAGITGMGDALKALDPKQLAEMFKGYNPYGDSKEGKAKTEGLASDIAAKFAKAQAGGSTEEMLKVLQDMPGDMGKNIMYLTQRMAKTGAIPKEMLELAAGKKTFKRPGAEPVGKYKGQAAIDAAAEKNDIQRLDQWDSSAGYSATLKSGADSVAKLQGDSAKKSADAQKETSTAVQDAASTADATLGAVEDTADSAAKANELFKKSPMSDQNKLSYVLKSATLDSMRTALMEFAILTQWDRIGKDWKDKFKDSGVNSLAGGMKVAGDWAVKEGSYGIDPNATPKAYADGGWTGNSPHMALMHEQEFVVPKGGALVKGGGKSVTVNGGITIHVHNGDPKAIEDKVNEIFSRGG